METVIIEAESYKIKALKEFLKAFGVSFKINKTKEKPYSSEFVSKIKDSQQQFKNGRYSTLSLDDVWKIE